MKKVVYTSLTADLFHYGHLRLLKFAKKCGDIHISGVLTDNALRKWYGSSLTNFNERKSVIQELKCVDEVIQQNDIDPTANLKKIYEKYNKKIKIILISSHQKWPELPGANFIKQINGRIIKPPYYERLSQSKIISYFKTEIDKLQFENFKEKNIILGDIHKFGLKFSTKANTLNIFKKIIKQSKIEPLFIFTVKQWQSKKNMILNEIKNTFNQNIVIRSSALDEDGLSKSNAGCYKSILNVNINDTKKIFDSIEEVIGSYTTKSKYNSKNQVLIQAQTKNVKISGVIFTRDLETNAPYYLINYDDETNQTDTVTSGAISKVIKIKRDININQLSRHWKKLMLAIKEIEELLPKMVLDIEFAVSKNNDIIIFQIRPLISNLKFKPIPNNLINTELEESFKTYDLNKTKNVSNDIYYSDMAFWNPAEIIGNRPNYLDYSLYQHLILNSAWNEALTSLGYSKVNDALMYQFCYKPYINLHHVFLTLTPEIISNNLKKKLINYYNRKIKASPYLHDKLEFDLVFNAYFFNVEKELNKLKSEDFTSQEIKSLRTSLFELTNNILKNYINIYKADILKIKKLGLNRNKIIQNLKKTNSTIEILKYLNRLFEDCRTLGVIPFSRNARLAFIGTGFLKTAVIENIISENEMFQFMNSIKTVAKQFDIDFNKLITKKLTLKSFISKYGHLRPGAYDITKLRYADNHNYFDIKNSFKDVDINFTEKNKFKELSLKLNSGLKKLKLNIDGDGLLDFIKTFIESREKMKFEFTKNLSLIIELIADITNKFGILRNEAAYLDYHSLNMLLNTNSKSDVLELWSSLIKSRKEKKDICSKIPMPPVIFSKNDFEFVKNFAVQPNFITNKYIESELTTIEKNKNLKNKIILLEKADPGYDWIFTQKPTGLITKYGGAASHMAIRCSEFAIPAAIGVGETIFEKLLTKRKIILDCQKETIVYLF